MIERRAIHDLEYQCIGLLIQIRVTTFPFKITQITDIGLALRQVGQS